MNKVRKIGIIAIILMCVLGVNVFATDKVIVEKSEEFKIWENLSAEDKKNSIQPSFFDIKIEDSIKRSNYNNLLQDSEEIDESYDLREKQNIIVKNQQKTGACWAFSYSSIVESTMQKLHQVNSEISPMHLDYKTGQIFNRKVGDGGNCLLALAYSASGFGPVDEDDFTFDSVYDEEEYEEEDYYLKDINDVDLDCTPSFKIENAKMFANIYKTVSNGNIDYTESNGLTVKNYTEEEVLAVRKLIKNHIKEKGAVSAVIKTKDSVATCYNAEHSAYYVPSSLLEVSDHAITIVGWDDNFSKDNFKENNKPVHNGAYIVLNSWGETFGDNGYFYISYDDAFIESNVYGIDDMEEINEENQNKIYEYDELGMTLTINALSDDSREYLDSAYVANVFSRDDNSEEYEYLTQVGIFLGSAEGIEIYVNPTGDDLANYELVASYTGNNALETGYHTLELGSPVPLTGDKFAVIVKYINSEITRIPLECNLYESGLTDEAENSYITAKSNAGESFYSKDGENWDDLLGYDLTGSGEYILKDTNACIKALTISSDTEIEIPVTGVKLNKESQTIQIGDTITIVATVNPTWASNKKITWESADEQIATVENGVVTGVSEGTTTIKAISEDGEKEAIFTVTVTKKASSDDDIYKEDPEKQEPASTEDPAGEIKPEQTNAKDQTTSIIKLPNTGAKITFVAIIGILIIAIIKFVRYIKLKEIK